MASRKGVKKPTSGKRKYVNIKLTDEAMSVSQLSKFCSSSLTETSSQDVSLQVNNSVTSMTAEMSELSVANAPSFAESSAYITLPSDDEENRKKLYQVKNIVGKKEINGEIFYLVRWQDTLEPERNLKDTCPHLIEAFEANQFNIESSRGEFSNVQRQNRSDNTMENMEDNDENDNSSLEVDERNPTNTNWNTSGSYVPVEVTGATDQNGVKFRVKFINRTTGESLEKFVSRKETHKHIPNLLCKFYQRHVKFI